MFEGVTSRGTRAWPLLAWLWLACLPAQASDLWTHCKTLDDPTRALTFSEVRQSTFQTPSVRTSPPRFGFTNSAAWLECRLDATPGNYVLTLDHIYLNDVQVFVERDGQWTTHRFGLDHPFAPPEVFHYGYALDFEVTPTTGKVVYLRATSTCPITWPLKLVPRDTFQKQERALDWMFGMYMGIIFILIAYNLFIYQSVREPAYLYYIATLFCLHLYSTLAQYGLVRAFLFPEWSYFQSHLFYFTHPLTTVSLYLFANQFLQLRENGPRLRYILFVPMCANLGLLAVGLFTNTYQIDLGFQISSSIFSYGLFGIGAYLAYTGVKQARYFIVAWSLLIVFWMVTFLRIDGVVPLNFFTSYSVLLGAALEGLLLSLALADRLNQLRSDKEKAEIQAFALTEKAKVIQQVAHDIRAPLAALEVAVREQNELDDEGRLLVRRAVSRIRDITNDLRSQTPLNTVGLSSSLPVLVDFIVGEKRLQYTSLPHIEIDWKIEQKDRSMFAHMDIAGLKRVVFNLIDNSVEAMKECRGTIRIRLSREAAFHVLTIEDDGPGISEQVLAKLGVEPVTFGKENTAAGTGLGVFHAANTVRGWGGDLRCENGEKGARVTLCLRPAEPPTWFLPELSLPADSLVVVVDDDLLLKRAWSQRLEAVGAEVVYFTQPEEVLQWVKVGKPARQITFLLDYEFRNSMLTGLDLVDALQAEGTCVLATNNFDAAEIQEGCRKRGIKMIAKSLLGIVPIRMTAPAGKRDALVLIDDDALVRLAWDLVAKEKGINLQSYESFDAFWSNKDNTPMQTPIFMDALLADEAPVDERLKQLKQFGFEEVHIQTGLNPERLADLPGCAGVSGKDFPDGF